VNSMPPIDLVALVPGKDDREALAGLLESRWQSLGIRHIHAELLVHPRRDPGCFYEAPFVLQTYQRLATRALVLFDHEGCGQESRSSGDLEIDLEGRLARSGWDDRARVVVIEPELENWVWSDSPHVDAILGWSGRRPDLRRWLVENGFWPASCSKPPRPKETMDAALRQARVRRSSSIFRQLAESVSLDRCQDAKFGRLRQLLGGWFSSHASVMSHRDQSPVMDKAAIFDWSRLRRDARALCTSNSQTSLSGSAPALILSQTTASNLRIKSIAIAAHPAV